MFQQCVICPQKKKTCRKAIPAETPCVLHEDHEVVLAHHPIFVLQTNGMNPMHAATRDTAPEKWKITQRGPSRSCKKARKHVTASDSSVLRTD